MRDYLDCDSARRALQIDPAVEGAQAKPGAADFQHHGVGQDFSTLTPPVEPPTRRVFH